MAVTSLCSRIKHESSSSDEEHAATKPSSTSHLPLLSSVSYKKTLRLTSEQLVRALSSCRCNVGSGPAPAARAQRVPWTGGTRFPPSPAPSQPQAPSLSQHPLPSSLGSHPPHISVPPVQEGSCPAMLPCVCPGGTLVSSVGGGQPEGVCLKV